MKTFKKSKTVYIENSNLSNLFRATLNEGSSFSFDKVFFNKQLTTLIHCPIPVKGRYSIPHTVTSIGIEAFAQCKELTSVIIPSSIKTIGCLAFYNCICLTSITIPDSIIEFGYRAFSNCAGLKTILVRTIQPVILKPDSDIFLNVDKSTCILYVPVGSKRDYQLAEQWKEFKNILEANDFEITRSNKIYFEETKQAI